MFRTVKYRRLIGNRNAIDVERSFADGKPDILRNARVIIIRSLNFRAYEVIARTRYRDLVAALVIFRVEYVLHGAEQSGRPVRLACALTVNPIRNNRIEYGIVLHLCDFPNEHDIACIAALPDVISLIVQNGAETVCVACVGRGKRAFQRIICRLAVGERLKVFLIIPLFTIVGKRSLFARNELFHFIRRNRPHDFHYSAFFARPSVVFRVAQRQHEFINVGILRNRIIDAVHNGNAADIAYTGHAVDAHGRIIVTDTAFAVQRKADLRAVIIHVFFAYHRLCKRFFGDIEGKCKCLRFARGNAALRPHVIARVFQRNRNAVAARVGLHVAVHRIEFAFSNVVGKRSSRIDEFAFVRFGFFHQRALNGKVYGRAFGTVVKIRAVDDRHHVIRAGIGGRLFTEPLAAAVIVYVINSFRTADVSVSHRADGKGIDTLHAVIPNISSVFRIKPELAVFLRDGEGIALAVGRSTALDFHGIADLAHYVPRYLDLRIIFFVDTHVGNPHEVIGVGKPYFHIIFAVRAAACRHRDALAHGIVIEAERPRATSIYSMRFSYDLSVYVACAVE